MLEFVINLVTSFSGIWHPHSSNNAGVAGVPHRQQKHDMGPSGVLRSTYAGAGSNPPTVVLSSTDGGLLAPETLPVHPFE